MDNLRGTITSYVGHLIPWYVDLWMAGKDVEVVKDCGEYWGVKVPENLPSTRNHFYLPKKLFKIKNPPDIAPGR